MNIFVYAAAEALHLPAHGEDRPHAGIVEASPARLLGVYDMGLLLPAVYAKTSASSIRRGRYGTVES